MRATTKLTIVAVLGLCFSGIGSMSRSEVQATGAVNVQESSPTITINVEGGDPYTYEPAELNITVGQAITITNNDPMGVHSVTADDRTFDVDVPPNSSATLTIEQAGSYPYNCTYHPGQHNPASITVS